MTFDTSWWQRGPQLKAWSEVDPARFPFDAAQAPAVVRLLSPPVPPRPTFDGTTRSGDQEAWRWYQALTDALTGYYGPWAHNWSAGDSSGPWEPAWQDLYESVSTPDETLTRVAASLVDWRGHLEALAERFERFLPAVRADPGDNAAWEVAIAHLISTSGVWTGYAGGRGYWLVIWFLTAAGQPVDASETAVRLALHPYRQSVYDPLTAAEVADVAEAVAQAVAGRPRLAGQVSRPRFRAEDWPDTWPQGWPSWRATNRSRM